MAKKAETVTIRKKGEEPITFKEGGLHRSLGVPKGEKIPAGKMAEALGGKHGPKAAKQARFAEGALKKGRQTAAANRAADGALVGRFRDSPFRPPPRPDTPRLISPLRATAGDRMRHAVSTARALRSVFGLGQTGTAAQPNFQLPGRRRLPAQFDTRPPVLRPREEEVPYIPGFLRQPPFQAPGGARPRRPQGGMRRAEEGTVVVEPEHIPHSEPEPHPAAEAYGGAEPLEAIEKALE